MQIFPRRGLSGRLNNAAITTDKRASMHLVRGIACAVLVFSFLLGSSGQETGPYLSARRVITLRAVLPSSVNLNPDSVGIDVAPPRGEGAEQTFYSLLDAEWNLDQSIREVLLVAFFADGNEAVRDSAGHPVNAAELEICVDEKGWRAFPRRIELHRSSALLLSSLKVAEVGRTGKRTYLLKLRLRSGAQVIPVAKYSGVLHFRTIMQ